MQAVFSLEPDRYIVDRYWPHVDWYPSICLLILNYMKLFFLLLFLEIIVQKNKAWSHF